MRYLKSRSVTGAAGLVASSVVAQLIALGVTPILSRIYPPEAFGYLTLVVSMSALVAPVIALRFESALMLPSQAKSATALLALGACSALIVSLAMVAALETAFFFGGLGEMASFPGFSWWVGGISFASGAFVLLGQFALRNHRYKSVARRNVTQAAVTAGGQLGLSLVGTSAAGLVGGYLAGRIAGVIPLALSLRGEVVAFSWRDMRAMAGEYRQFPLVFAPSALLNSAALTVPIIFAGLWFDVAEAGQWGMAERILALPMVIVAAAIGQVVEARLSQHHRDLAGGTAAYYVKVSSALALFSALVSIVVIVAAPVVVPFVLGPGWDDAAVMMQLMVPMLAARLVTSPVSKILVTFRRAGLNLLLDGSRLLLIVGVLGLAIIGRWNVFELVLGVSLTFAVAYVASWIVGLIVARQYDAKISAGSAEDSMESDGGAVD